eukprot:Gb_06538 [translate_table: standard]
MESVQTVAHDIMEKHLENPIVEKPGLENEKKIAGDTTAVEEGVIVASDIINTHNHGNSEPLLKATQIEDALMGTQNPSTNSPSTADSTNSHKKRPRDKPEMSEHEHNMDQESVKVPKLDTEDGTEENKEQGAVPHKRPPKRRKIAILLAYCGVGYQGMQRNPGAKTIEGDLEEALFKSGAISEDQYGDPRKVDWMRSARTDKGVSAVGQVVSGRFFIDPPGLVERINSNLPEQIRVFGYKRVTPSFSAKKFCDRRRYEYVLPVFALDPTAHRDRESVLASEGKEGALVKCLECSERGRKVFGLMGKRNENGRAIMHVEVEAVSEKELIDKVSGNDTRVFENTKQLENLENIEILKNPEELEKPQTLENFEEKKIVENSEKLEKGQGPEIEPSATIVGVEKSPDDGVNSLEKTLVPNSNSEPSVAQEESETKNIPIGQNDGASVKSSFCYGENERNRFNSILKQFVGTHNFHNLTTRTKAEDPAAYRYILSFEASDVFTIDGMDFVRCTILGQSFMLHQIRKMIGLAVAVMRDCAPESMIATALRKDVHINVPTAPELGLFLDESLFPAYNQKWQATHEEVCLKGYEQQISEFKKKYIYTHIATTEVKDGVVALWLHSLNHRNYPDFVAAREAEKIQNGTESQNTCGECS